MNESMNVLGLTYLQRLFPRLLNLAFLFCRELVRTRQMNLIFNDSLLSTRHRVTHFFFTCNFMSEVNVLISSYTLQMRDWKFRAVTCPNLYTLEVAKPGFELRFLVSDACTIYMFLSLFACMEGVASSGSNSDISPVCLSCLRTPIVCISGTQCHSVTHPHPCYGFYRLPILLGSSSFPTLLRL